MPGKSKSKVGAPATKVKSKTPVNLPVTSFALLGLLTFGESSGYDLLKLTQQSIGFIWNPAKSHIYSELRKLVAHGLATELEVEQKGKPDKRLYKITAAGTQAFRVWLAAPETEEESVKNPFILKLFFGNHLESDVLLLRVQEYQDRMKNELDHLFGVEKVLKSQKKFFFPYLTVKSGIARRRAMIEWTTEVLGELKS